MIGDRFITNTKANTFNRIRVYGNRKLTVTNKKINNAKEKIISNTLLKIRRRILT